MHTPTEERLNIPATMELLRKVEKISSEWNASDKDPFGPSEECFSVEGIVYLSRRGATMRDLYHLSRCESCQNWVNNFVQVKAKIPTLAKTGQRDWWRNLAAIFGGVSKEVVEPDVHPNTVLYIPFSGLAVAPDLSVEFGILGKSSSNLDAIDVSSLRLFGGLTGNKATVQLKESHGLRYSVARFYPVELGEAAKKDLAKHKEAAHTVCLSGKFKGADTQEFRGQAYVNLLRA